MPKKLGALLPEGEAAGQKVSLVATIKSLIGDYPAGIGIVKEFLQNADDAGASWIKVTFDRRDFASSAEVPEKLRPLLGPSLLIESDQRFRDQDLDAIRRIGEGAKINDVARTGQFGKGFNTAYTVTDYPAFVTRDLLRCFDPLDDAVARPGEHGQQWKLRELWESIPAWPAAFGLPHDATDLETTVFRLPLRTPLQAREERLSPSPFTAEDVRGVFEEVRAFGPALLLFTRHVRDLRLCEISAQGKEREVVAFTTVDSEYVERHRAHIRIPSEAEPMTLLDEWRRDRTRCPVSVYRHRFHVREDGDEGRQLSSEWLIGRGFELGPSLELLAEAAKMAEIKKRAIPQVGFAVEVRRGPSGPQPTPCVATS